MIADERPAARPEEPTHPRLRKLLYALALTLAVELVCESILPQAGEPAWLRWLRVLADHPMRGFLAAFLLVHAFAPASPARPERENPAQPPRS